MPNTTLLKVLENNTSRADDTLLPEVAFQFFLLKQSWHNWPHEDFIGNGPDYKVSKDTDRTDPTSAAKQSLIYVHVQPLSL